MPLIRFHAYHISDNETALIRKCTSRKLDLGHLLYANPSLRLNDELLMMKFRFVSIRRVIRNLNNLIERIFT